MLRRLVGVAAAATASAGVAALQQTQLRVERALGDEDRLAWLAAGGGQHLRTRPGHVLGQTGGSHRHVGAEHERRRGLVGCHVEDGDAAADTDRARRGGDGDRMGFADLAADEPEHSSAGIDRQVARLGVGIVDEPVDCELGVGTDGERGAVEENEMSAIIGAGGDARPRQAACRADRRRWPR